MIFKKTVSALLLISSTFLTTMVMAELPNGFVYLHDIDPSIVQEMRYYSHHNFIGRPIKGYHAEKCILSKPAARQLALVQTELKQSGLSLKVYDCYRPQMAVDDFIEWSKDANQQQMKNEFYPHVDKADFFKLGYVAAKSGHTRGSTVDLTIVPIPTPKQKIYHPGDKLVSCIATYQERFHDNSIDMGTGYDCMDPLSHPIDPNSNLNIIAQAHRMMLRTLMMHYGFVPYSEEWWHFTLKDEPYPKTYFNFPVS